MKRKTAQRKNGTTLFPAALFNRRAALALATGVLFALGHNPAHAGNDAWGTSPTSANFSGNNWTVNSTTPARTQEPSLRVTAFTSARPAPPR